MNLGEIVKEFRIRNALTMDEFARRTGLSKGYISMLEKNKNPRTGKPITPSIETYDTIANAMRISIEELMTLAKGTNVALTSLSTKNLDFHPSLTKKDEKDIQKRLSDILNDMDSQDSIAMYNGGEPMDPETREYMKASLENALRFAKLKAKEKFTPKKHRK